MHFIFTTLALCLSMVLALPQGPRSEEPIAIISQTSNQEPDGGYQYSFETANGIKAQESGTLKKSNSPDAPDSISVAGSSSYTAPDGTVISLQYSADDQTGFVPVGDHLPTPPPVPEAIQKAVEYLLSLPPSTEGPRGKR